MRRLQQVPGGIYTTGFIEVMHRQLETTRMFNILSPCLSKAIAKSRRASSEYRKRTTQELVDYRCRRWRERLSLEIRTRTLTDQIDASLVKDK